MRDGAGVTMLFRLPLLIFEMSHLKGPGSGMAMLGQGCVANRPSAAFGRLMDRQNTQPGSQVTKIFTEPQAC